MPTTISQSTLDELGELIEKACDRGDNVSAIAERAGVPRQLVSALKNGTYPNSPTLEKVGLILDAIGYKICYRKAAG